MTKSYDAIWGFREDILNLRESFIEHVIKAHTSQPLGIPLHRYEGTLTVSEGMLSFSGRDKDTKEPSQLAISLEKVQDVYLGWDDVLRRWRDTRAWIRPLRITFEEGKESITLYLYVKESDALVYGRKNKELYELIK